MNKVKIYKVELLVMDLNHDFRDQNDLTQALTNIKHIDFSEVKNIEEREIEYSDEHPLNQKATSNQAYLELFK